MNTAKPLKFEPFPLYALPDPCRAYCKEAAKAMCCDPSMIAVPMLTMLASAIGNSRFIEVKPGWEEPPILWAMVVAPSGSQKSPALSCALKPLRKAEARAMKQYSEELTLYESATMDYELRLAKWRRGASGEEAPTKPVMPIALRQVVSDITTEALAGVLRDNPRGVLLARDELSGWFGSFDRYTKSGAGGGDSALWLEMNGGKEMRIDRKTGTQQVIYVPRASVSIIGGIQPGILCRKLTKEYQENGLKARFLFVMPPNKVKRWTDDILQPETERAVGVAVDGLLGLSQVRDQDGVFQPKVAKFNAAAQQKLIEFYNALNEKRKDLPWDLNAAAAKMEGLVPRLALIVHMTRWASGCAPPDDHLLVDEFSFGAAEELAQWFWNETERVYAMGNESLLDAETRELVDWIQQRGGKVSVRDLQRGPRRYRGKGTAAEESTEGALQALVDAGIGGWMDKVPGLMGGLPSRCFRLFTDTGDSGDGDTTPQNTENGAVLSPSPVLPSVRNVAGSREEGSRLPSMAVDDERGWVQEPEEEN